MATASISTRSIQGESLSAANDRLVNTALLKEGVIDFAGNSYKVAQDTGSNMQVKIGSGTAFDRAVVEGDNAGQGTFICEHANATQTLAVAAADATNPRIDIVVLRVRDDTFDSSGLDEADLEVIQGTPATSPVAPATPDSALKLAEIEVAAAVTAVTDADITDLRSEAPVRGQLVETLYFTADDTFTKADYPWLDRVVAKAQGGGGGGCSSETSGGGHGGGGGGYAETTVLVSALAASETVTVGAGGAGGLASNGTTDPGDDGGSSSFGTHAVGDGGEGGPNFGGGVGGSGTGDLVIHGDSGGSGLRAVVSDRTTAGGGGASHLGGGGRALGSGINVGATPGLLYGGGGGAGNAIDTIQDGGAGAAGIVIVELYA